MSYRCNALLLSFTLLLPTAGWAFYDAFPAHDAPYVSGPVSEALTWPGEDFESYEDGQVIECSSDKRAQTHFDVTSGCLSARHVGKWRRGWTDDRVFRVVFKGYDDRDQGIKWTDGGIRCRAYIQGWHEGNTPNWAGIHLFQRYQTSDDLYVASLRRDGLLTIKRKWNKKYTTLAKAQAPAWLLDEQGYLKEGRWIDLRFLANGNDLSFYLDGTLLLTASCSTLDSGTMGVRLDYMNVFLDQWSLFSVL